MARPIDELIGLLGYEYDPKGLDKFKEGMAEAGEFLAKFATGIGVFVGTTLAGVTALNEITASQEKMAKSVGLSSASLREWTGVAEDAGFEAETVVDLVEEMNNKMGESKGLGEVTTPVAESLAILGLEFEKIILLRPEEQFKTIADAIVKLDDAQSAVSAADILMGGEANKFFSLARSRGQTIDQMLGDQAKLNLLTQDSADSALWWSTTVNQLRRVFQSAGQEISGIFAGFFSDSENLAESFAKFFNENREGITEFIKNVVDLTKASIKLFGELFSGFNFVIDLVGGANNAFKLLGAAIGIFLAFKLGSIIVAIALAFQTLTFSAVAAQIAVLSIPIAIGIAIAAAVAAIIWLVKNWDTVVQAFNEGLEFIKDSFVKNWDTIVQVFNEGLEFIKDSFVKSFDAITGFGGKAIAILIKGVKSYFSFWLKGFETVKKIIGKVGSILGIDGDVDVNQRVTSDNIAGSGAFAATGGGSTSSNNDNSRTIEQNNSIQISSDNPNAVGEATAQTLERWSSDTTTNQAVGVF